MSYPEQPMDDEPDLLTEAQWAQLEQRYGDVMLSVGFDNDRYQIKVNKVAVSDAATLAEALELALKDAA